MSRAPANHRDQNRRFHLLRDPIFFGGTCGLISAVAYTAANVCLRAVSNCDPIWVSCVKTAPTIALVGPWLLVLTSRGIHVIPTRGTLLAIVLAGAFGHLGGNVLFQWSLGVIGIALSVPIVLGTIIVTGAIMGRLFLNEEVTTRSAISIAILIAAICVLSLGAGDAHRSIAQVRELATGSLGILTIAAGVIAAATAGLAYSILGVVIRYGVTKRSPVSSTMVLISAIGIVVLMPLSYVRLGVTGILATSSTDFGVMILAGLFNAAAFLTLTKALQVTTLTYVNALNASQAAMAALAGVLMFGEPPTGAMTVGVLLTMVGLTMIDGRDKSRRSNEPKTRGSSLKEIANGPAKSTALNSELPTDRPSIKTI